MFYFVGGNYYNLLMPTFSDRILDRVPSEDDTHIKSYPFLVTTAAVLSVNRALKLPSWHWSHDQGAEGACVGHGSSMMKSILDGGRRYNPFWLWNESKKIDEWSDTNPGDDNGTSVRASCDVLRNVGHSRWNKEQPDKAYGIASNKWATTVDQMRASLALGIPVSIGINWYANFDQPVQYGKEWWIGRGNLGGVRGGHCVCVYGASDKRQAFRIKNSWGRDYPLVWLPYSAMSRLLDEQGEATLVTDL